MIGGTVLSALVHPWSMRWPAIEVARGSLLARPEEVSWLAVLDDGLDSTLSGYLASMAVGFLAVRGRGHRRDLLSRFR